MSADASGLQRSEAANGFMRGLILALTLVLCCVLGLITPYLLVVLGMVVFAVMLVRGTYVRTLREDRAAQLFLATFAGLAICFAITAREPGDLVYALNFIALILYAPVAALMRHGARSQNATRLADLALAGTVVAFLAGTAGLFVFGWPRGESPILGAILLANTALLLSFLSLIGTLVGGRRRWLYLAGPVLAVALVAMTGSRGPLLGLVPLTLIAAWFIRRELGLRLLVVAGGTAAFLALGGLIVFAFDSRSATLVSVVGEILGDSVRGTGGGALERVMPDASQDATPVEGAPVAVADSSTRIRLALYEAGIRAFLERPLFGHGWARLMSSIEPHLAPDFKQYAVSLPQLHNDVLNFAVAAGAAGVALYVLLIATPLVALFMGPRDRLFQARFYGIVVLTVGYLFAGLTDLMFGFEFHTVLFTFVTAILLGYCREPPPAPP